MTDPVISHQCPRCDRVWPLPDFLALPMLGVEHVQYRQDGYVKSKPARLRRCMCGQKLQQSETL